MNEISEVSSPLTKSKEDSYVETELNRMTTVGEPRLAFMEGGWYCRVEMFVWAKGAKFTITSEYNHPTIRSAVRECAERIAQALKK